MAADNLPIGTILIWAGDQGDLPSTWKVCNGKQLKKTDYPDLYGTLGTRWDNDNGYNADFFSIPDLRGVFLRGVNDDRNDGYHDPDVSNRVRLKGNSTVSMDDAGSFQLSDVGQHQHYINQTTEANKDENGPKDNVGPITHDPSAIYKSISLMPIPTEENPHNETRPVNAYVYYIIKVNN